MARATTKRTGGRSREPGRNRARAKTGRTQRTPVARWSLVGLAVGCCIVGAGLLVLRGGDADQPNLLLITLDTTRADHLSCYGSEFSETPNLDRLAQRGAWFSACTTSSPTTLPSHSSLMTSRTPFILGVRRNGVNALTPAAVTLAERLKAAGYTTGATVAAFVLSRRFGIDQGFEVYHEVTPTTPGTSMTAERPGDEVCDDAIRLLESFGDRPFFLWVHFFDAHYPYLPRKGAEPNSPEAYSREIEFVDEQVGRVMAALDRLGFSDSTLTVVVGDHGEDLQDHGEVTHGYFLYDSTVRVPLIFHDPGVLPEGCRFDDRVGIVDVAPTILDALGLPGLPDAAGASLMPIMKGTGEDADHAVYSETLEPRSQLGLAMLRSLAWGEWKYILAPTPELYNVVTDPGETMNVVADHPERAQRMRDRLREMVATAGPPLESAGRDPVLQSGDIDKLRSLGYLEGGDSGVTDLGENELSQFEPVGADPKDHVMDHRRLVESLVLIQAGRYADAQVLLREIISAAPGSLQAYLSLIEVLRAQERDAEAVEACERALDLAPGNELIVPSYARALRSTGRHEEAIEQFERLLENPVGRVMAHAELAMTYMAIGDAKSAEDHVRAALEIEPSDPRLLQMLTTFEAPGKAE